MNVSKLPLLSGILLGIAIGLFGGAMLWAKAGPQEAKTPDVIRAQRFEVVNAEGKVVAVLGPVPDQGLGLTLRHKDGHGGTTIFTAPDGTQHLMMVDAKHQTALDLRADDDASMRMVNAKQKKERTLKP